MAVGGRFGVVPRLWPLTVAVVVLLLFSVVDGRKSPPLLDDSGSKKLVRASECTFAGQARELGSTWFADLGPPFGVMYCIKCECVPILKKHKVVAKVQCKNIKDECPKPTCDEPVLYPGICCKICPGDLFSLDSSREIPEQVTHEEDEKGARHFAALMTGSERPPATARFWLRRRSLYISIEGGGDAKSIQLIDSEGLTLQEVPLATKMMERSCTSWRRLPRDYRRILREGKMSAGLKFDDESKPQLIGQIITHGALNTEIFSALLELQPDYGVLTNDWGATAAISTHTGATPFLHIALMFNVILSSEEITNSNIEITVENVEKNTTVLKEISRLKKPAGDLNIVEVSTPVNISTLRLLARGRATLSMRVNRTNNGFKTILKGPILPKLSCEMFYAPLIAGPRAEPQIASGVTWFHFNRESALEYKVQVDELDMMKSPMITLVDETNKRRIDLEQLAHFQNNGKATGILDKMGPKIFEPLYFGDLVVDVTTYKTMSKDTTVELVRGKLISRPVADVMDLNGPILLKRLDLTRPANISGLAWISVDHECSIQWEVAITGSNLASINLELWVDLRMKLAVGAPVISVKLGNLDNPEGVMLSPSLTYLDLLQSGACELVVKDSLANITFMRAVLKQMKVPDTCLSQNNNNEMQPAYDPSTSNSVIESGSCTHAGIYYSDGSQWTSSEESCTLCSCLHGTVRCDPIICPVLPCGVKAIKRPGECCSSCPNPELENENISSTTQGCFMAGQFHSAGQSWHPYIPPNGFDTCIICTCDPRVLQVNYSRITCPPLKCNKTDAIKPDKNSCCKECRPKSQSNKYEPNDEAGLTWHDRQERIDRRDRLELLAEGGCKFARGEILRNGEERHPSLPIHGENKCAICKCKNGVLICNKKKCSKTHCNGSANRRRPPLKNGINTALSSTEECCLCRRNRRHQKHRRNNMSA